VPTTFLNHFDLLAPPFYVCIMTGWRREGVPQELYAKGYARKLIDGDVNRLLSGEVFRCTFEEGHPPWAITGFYLVDSRERPFFWHEVDGPLVIGEHDILHLDWSVSC
jgi:hypothetical protein